MTPFDFVCVFYSVVLGVAVAQLMTDLGQLVEHRDRVRTYWVHSLWIFTILFASVGNWWGIWSARSVKIWYFHSLALLVGFAGAIYVATVLLFPRIPETVHLDLKQHFYKSRRPFFCATASFWALGTLANWTFFHFSLLDVWIIVPGTFLFLSIGAVFISNEGYHIAFALLAALVHIGFLFFTGGAPLL